MGLFTPYHGNYEVTYKANTYPPVSWDKEKEKTMVVEADDLQDARRQAEKQLKSSGYSFCHIVNTKLIKTTPGSRASNERRSNEEKTTYSYSSHETSTSDYSSNTKSGPVSKASAIIAGVIFLIIIAIVGGVLIKSCASSMNLEGTYYLVSITGNQQMSANKNENYLTLKDGTCTLHLNLQEPAGNSVLTYHYTGNRTTNIEFDRDFIHMDLHDRVVIQLNYGNGFYNILTYEKRD